MKRQTGSHTSKDRAQKARDTFYFSRGQWNRRYSGDLGSLNMLKLEAIKWRINFTAFSSLGPYSKNGNNNFISSLVEKIVKSDTRWRCREFAKWQIETLGSYYAFPYLETVTYILKLPPLRDEVEKSGIDFLVWWWSSQWSQWSGWIQDRDLPDKVFIYFCEVAAIEDNIETEDNSEGRRAQLSLV